MLPGTGLALPPNAGVLRFGMSEQAAQWVASTLENVRPWEPMRGVRWMFSFVHGGVQVTAYACTACTEQTLGHLVVERCERVPDGPADVPVVVGDIDLFGYPIHELIEVLEPAERKLLLSATLNPRSTHYLAAVRLDACEDDRR